MDRVTYEEPISATDLYGLIASRELAISWIDAGETNSDLASALTELASLKEPGSAPERELLEQAISATEAGLAQGPADPRSWTRLAYLRSLLKAEPDQKAAQALAFSLETGRYDQPDFLAQRLHLILLHWPVMPDSVRARAEDQMELIWQEAPDELVGLALQEGFTDIILTALADTPVVRSQLLDVMRGVIQAK